MRINTQTIRTTLFLAFAAMAFATAWNKQSRAAEAEAPATPRRAAGSSARGPEMVRIPAGSFVMGSSDGRKDQQPVHEVHVDAFEMDKTEVTVAQYRMCVEVGACDEPKRGAWKYAATDNFGASDRDTHPINGVSWPQADAFCRWAHKRLPTEEEWEYAARGADGRRYPWGNANPSASTINACDAEECVSWAKSTVAQSWKAMYEGSDGHAMTAPVGSFPDGASPFGLLDMAGNVWEWTSSSYSADYSSERPDDKEAARVARGGSWSSSEESVTRATYRFRMPLSAHYGSLGMRCAR